ncbi:MAG: helix-turn-helix transcriptional regulator [Ferruginibacter sp.]|nr:helix-turn-helix transcriptional regulator [Cytophagales bacterium]
MRKLSSVHYQNEQIITTGCPITSALALFTGRWKLHLMWQLNKGTRRFGELRKAIPAITVKMLSQQLREMERDGLVTRVVYPEVPPKVEYTLSELGRSFVPILKQIYDWAEENQLTEPLAG